MISFADMGTPGGKIASIGTASGYQLYAEGKSSSFLSVGRSDSTTFFILKLCVSSTHFRSKRGNVRIESIERGSDWVLLNIVRVVAGVFDVFANTESACGDSSGSSPRMLCTAPTPASVNLRLAMRCVCSHTSSSPSAIPSTQVLKSAIAFARDAVFRALPLRNLPSRRAGVEKVLLVVLGVIVYWFRGFVCSSLVDCRCLLTCCPGPNTWSVCKYVYPRRGRFRRSCARSQTHPVHSK